jgi:hypothetical protein
MIEIRTFEGGAAKLHPFTARMDLGSPQIQQASEALNAPAQSLAASVGLGARVRDVSAVVRGRDRDHV